MKLKQTSEVTSRVETLTADLAGLAKGLPISYVGGKKKMISWLVPLLAEQIPTGTTGILDGFSGSGIVSAVLTCLGRGVVSCDVLKSSYCLTVTLAQNPGEVISDDDVAWLSSHRCVDGVVIEGDDEHRGVAEATNGLTRSEAAWLEFAYRKAESLSPYRQMIAHAAIRGIGCLVPFGTSSGSSTYKHRVKQKDQYGDRCLGCYLTDSYELDVVDRYPKYLRSFNAAVERMSDLRLAAGIAHRADVIEVLEAGWASGVEVAYYDPPYGTPRKAGYADLYVLNEGLLHAEEIPGATPFSAGSHSQDFERLLDASRGIGRVIISHDSNSWCDLEYMTRLLERFGRVVTVASTEHVHGKVPMGEDWARRVTEYVIVADETKKRGRKTGV